MFDASILSEVSSTSSDSIFSNMNSRRVQTYLRDVCLMFILFCVTSPANAYQLLQMQSQTVTPQQFSSVRFKGNIHSMAYDESSEHFFQKTANTSLPAFGFLNNKSFKFKRKSDYLLSKLHHMGNSENRAMASKISPIEVKETHLTKRTFLSDTYLPRNVSDFFTREYNTTFNPNYNSFRFPLSSNLTTPSTPANSKSPFLQLPSVQAMQNTVNSSSSHFPQSLRHFPEEDFESHIRQRRTPLKTPYSGSWPEQPGVTTVQSINPLRQAPALLSSSYSSSYSSRGYIRPPIGPGHNMTALSAIQLKPYPPLGTLGPYGEDWFPDTYRNNHRKNDSRSSTGAPGVEITSLYMPQLIQVGDNITITCNFKILGNGVKIYTVNWWRDGDQFYISNQKTQGNRSSYQFPGITVDDQQSSGRSVVLLSVTEATGGRYKCEVMTEAPSFKTAVMYKNMTVIVPPSSLTIAAHRTEGQGQENTSPLSGQPPLYKYGQEVRLNCTAKDAKPKVDLYWKINGRNVTTTVHHTDRRNANDRITSTIELSFMSPRHFIGGRAVVTCLATVQGGQPLTYTSKDIYLDLTSRPSYSAQASTAGPTTQTSLMVAVCFILTLTSNDLIVKVFGKQ